MTNVRRSLAGDERGAVLVHAAIAMLALIAFSALAIDYGALLVEPASGAERRRCRRARGRTVARVRRSGRHPAGPGRRRRPPGAANQVLGAAPSIVPATDVQLIPCPPGAPGLPDTCIRADVYRSAARSNALPTFFAQIMGITSQDVRATATAQVLTGNAVGVHEAVGRRGQVGRELGERRAEHRSLDTGVGLRQVQEAGQRLCARSGRDHAGRLHRADRDQIRAPASRRSTPMATRRPITASRSTLKIGSSENRLSSGWFQALDSAERRRAAGSGGADYRNNIRNCNPARLPDRRHADRRSEQGNMVGPTKQGRGGGPGGWADERIPALPGTRPPKSIQGSCAPGICADGQYHARSPRIVPVPLFDIDAFFAGSPNGKTTVTITNIMGFFIEGMGGPGNKDVIGRLVAIPGLTEAERAASTKRPRSCGKCCWSGERIHT